MNGSSKYFEITDNDNSIRIEIINQPYSNSEIDYDKNWLKASVKVKVGAFSGDFFADLQTYDFKIFMEELEIAFNNLNRNAMFEGIESQVKIHLTGNGTGNFEVNFSLMDKAGFGNELKGEFIIDQTRLPEIINQLSAINTLYPTK